MDSECIRSFLGWIVSRIACLSESKCMPLWFIFDRLQFTHNHFDLSSCFCCETNAILTGSNDQLDGPMLSLMWFNCYVTHVARLSLSKPLGLGNLSSTQIWQSKFQSSSQTPDVTGLAQSRWEWACKLAVEVAKCVEIFGGVQFGLAGTLLGSGTAKTTSGPAIPWSTASGGSIQQGGEIKQIDSVDGIK